MAVVEKCFGAICFHRLPEGIPQVFGFSEYLTGLALMVIAWTLADYRYHFRLETAAFPIKDISFWSLSCLGLLAIATDVWRAEGFWVPSGPVFSPVGWQVFLAFFFLCLFLSWAWFGLMSPSRLGKRNAERFKDAVQKRVLSGGEQELALLADELKFSAEQIVTLAPSRFDKELKGAGLATRDLLLTLADPRFCNVVVSQRPVLAMRLYDYLGKQDGNRVGFNHLSMNLATAAFTHENSVLVYETDGYATGFMGYARPFSRAFFGNSSLVEAVGSMFDVDYRTKEGWGKREWDLYARAILIFLEDRLTQSKDWSYSHSLYVALDSMTGFGAFTLSNVDSNLANENRAFQRFSRSCKLMKDILTLLSKQPEIDHYVSVKSDSHSLFSTIAENAYSLLETASYVQDQGFFCWEVQHNMAWSAIFRGFRTDNSNTRIIHKLVSRRVFDKIGEIGEYGYPGYDAARLLGLCINIFVLNPTLQRSTSDKIDKSFFALKTAVLLWVRHHFSWLYSQFPEVAEAALVEKVQYDASNYRLVIKSTWLRRGHGRTLYFDVDQYVLPPPSGQNR